MIEVDVLAVAAAAVAAFVQGSVYYVAFGRQLSRLDSAAAGSDRTPPWKALVELVRSLVLGTVLAGLASRTEVDGWPAAVLLALAVWVGFAVVLLTGSVIWENVPWRLAAIHAGDWLVKVVLITLVVSLWSPIT
jgi:hypothetical protein